MYRKALIALVAVTALAVAVPLDASVARGHHGGGHGGGHGWHGGGGISGVRSFHTTGIGRAWHGASMGRTWHGASMGRAWRGGRFAHSFHRHRRFSFASAPLLYAAPYWYDDYFYDGCYQFQPVPTRWGLSWQRVWVCY